MRKKPHATNDLRKHRTIIGTAIEVLKKVYRKVHLFFILSCGSFLSYGQNASFFSENLSGSYQQVLDYSFSSWPIINLDQTKSEDIVGAIYINSLSGAFRQIFENYGVADSDFTTWEYALKTKLDDPNAKLCLAEIHLHRSITYFYSKNEFQSFLHFRKAHKIAEDLKTEHPSYLPALKTNGTLQLMLGSVPEKYIWLLKLLGYEGSIESGMEQLEALVQAKHDFGVEARILMIVFSQYLLDQNALESAKQLLSEAPGRQVVRMVHNGIALKTQNSEFVLADTSFSTIPLVLVQIGEAYLNKLQSAKAADFFKAYLDKQLNNASAEMLYKYWLSQVLQKDSSTANVVREMIKTNKNVVSEADIYGQHLAKSNRTPHINNIKIRLLTDGGYFEEAASLVNSIELSDFTDEIDAVEFQYRKARYLHLVKNYPAAIATYKKVLEKDKMINEYFFPSAAYHLANIYLQQNDKILARNMFQRVLQYADYPYESGLRQKSKIKLRAISAKK